MDTDDPLAAWVREHAADQRPPGPFTARSGRERRRLAAAVRGGIGDAADAAHPDDPQASAQITALLLETDADTWPLLDGTDLVELPPRVRQWLAAAEGAPESAEHPMLVPLSTAVLERVRARFVTGDEVLGALWLDFEDASGVDGSELAPVPYFADERDEAAGARPRARLSLTPFAMALASGGLVLSLAQLLGTGGPGWVAFMLVAAMVGFLSGRAIDQHREQER